jgi:hypothetical protein
MCCGNSPACCFVTVEAGTIGVAIKRRGAKSCIIRPLLYARLEAAQTYRRGRTEMDVAGKYAILLYLTYDISIIAEAFTKA